MDIGWGFPPQFYNKGKTVRMVADADDIKESLQILFSTALNERLNYSNYGCDLKKFMFEDANYTMVLELKQMILDAIYYFEPRITPQKVEITESEDNAHLLLINIDYVIKGTNSAQTLVYPVSLF